MPRLIGAGAAIGVSFVYVVVQIYGVGLITSHLTGFGFELGVFVGLGGVLVCSFLGGMRAVTWTQVAQYLVLMVAFLVPLTWLSVNQTGSWLPMLSYGQQLERVAEIERALTAEKVRAVQALDELASEREGRLEPTSAKLLSMCFQSGRHAATDAAVCRRRAGRREGRRWRRGRASPALRRGAHQFHRPGAVPDDGYRRHAARADALLHHTFGFAGAALGGLVAVLHHLALRGRARAGGAGQVRGAAACGRAALRRTAGLGEPLVAARPQPGVGARRQRRRAAAVRRADDGRRPAWWRWAAWPPRCPPPTACC